MEYTPTEKEILAHFNRTDFKNITKNELISCASKINDLRPEVAKEVIAQFPEFVKLIQSTATEHKKILEKIIASDDESITQVYGILDKELETSTESYKEFINLANKVLEDLSISISNDSLSEEEKAKIRDQEIEILKMIDKKDNDIRQYKKEIVEKNKKKDSEKRHFNWKIIGTASIFTIAIVCISGAALGTNFDFKFTTKS